MSADEGLLAWVQEALEPMGRVTKRHMMGVVTLYLDGTIFAVLREDEIGFKADAETNDIWDREGCARFTFHFKNKNTESINYRRAPLDVYDDPEAMRRWAALGVEAGARSAARKKPKR